MTGCTVFISIETNQKSKYEDITPEILEGLESDTDEETELQILMIFIVII